MSMPGSCLLLDAVLARVPQDGCLGRASQLGHIFYHCMYTQIAIFALAEMGYLQ